MNGISVRNSDNELSVGNFIRKHRKIAGLTQLELARLAGVGKSVVFDIEKDKETVQFNSVLKVLNTLNIKIQFVSPLQTLQKDK